MVQFISFELVVACSLLFMFRLLSGVHFFLSLHSIRLSIGRYTHSDVSAPSTSYTQLSAADQRERESE